MATILVVEDRPTDRLFLATLLGYVGHRVFEASDGGEGLDSARQHRPQLIISDVLMPSIDGYEFVRRLRQIDGIGQTPVIFYTAAYHEREAWALAKQCGVVDILTKPSEPETILAAVNAVLSRLPRPTAVESEGAEPFDGNRVRVVNAGLSEKISDLEGAEQRLAAVLGFCQRFATERDPGALLRHLCAFAREVTLAKHAIVALVNGDGTAVDELVTSGIDEETRSAMDAPSPMAVGVRDVLAGRQALRRCNAGGRPELLGLPANHPSTYSYLAVPIASPSRVYGWLSVHNKLGADDFAVADERVLLILGVHAGIAYENARLADESRRHASTLRETQERTQYALGAARTGLWDLDLTTDRITWSDTMALVFGLTPDRAPATGEAFLSLIHPDDRQAVADSMTRAAVAAVTYKVEFRAMLPDGRTRWVAGQARLFRTADGTPSRLLGVGTDVAERKEADQALERSRVDQMRFKDEFLSHVSHELRSPLTAIKQFTTILLGGLAGELNKEQREYQEVVLNNAQQLQSMIDDLLEVTRLESGQLSIESERASVSDAITDALATLRAAARTKGVAFSCNLSPGLPSAYADQARIRQIVTILVDNAIKWTSNGETVVIQARLLERDPRFMLLEVSDTGGGVSSEMTEKIFERLHQAPASTATSRNGLGLNLYICRELVTRQGGQIWVERKLEGSTFSFTVPVLRDDALDSMTSVA